MTISHVSLASIWVTDQDEAKAFYIDALGFEEAADITLDNGYRWLTVRHPDQPSLELGLARPGPPLSDDDAATVQKLLDKGSLNACGLATDDCRATYEELTAKGVEFIQPPADRPYGVEALFRDSSGNWIVLVEAKEWDDSVGWPE